MLQQNLYLNHDWIKPCKTELKEKLDFTFKIKSHDCKPIIKIL